MYKVTDDIIYYFGKVADKNLKIFKLQNTIVIYVNS